MFKYDGPIFRFLSRVLDLIVLNLLWTLCCVPVVTIGASTGAMYTVLFKMKEDKDYSVFKQFFIAFRANFKQSTFATLVLLPFAALLYIDYRVIYFDESYGYAVLSGLFWVALAVFTAYFSWIFPLISKFENSFGKMLKNTWYMMLRHLPATLVITFLNLSPFLLFYFAPQFSVDYLMLVWLFIGFSTIAFVNSQLLYRVFEQYFPKDSEKG